MKFGVIVFPGSNCDHDAFYAVTNNLGQKAEYIWHDSGSLGDVDAVILPGGFSYGDYLRCGAIARFSPVMEAVMEFAAQGKPVIGICNGFQVLCESGLLPGALMRNDSLQFRCEWTHLLREGGSTPWLGAIPGDEVIHLPISHGEGNYFADAETLARLERDDRIVFRYSNAAGQVIPAANPNGSVANIAGIINERGNVLGMMPHPERASELLTGGTDGNRIWESIIQSAVAVLG
jgi:phosphoribosylformylglycinamidine synthase subunit PurQ / glutaminase